jgi:hypothetical protein
MKKFKKKLSGFSYKYFLETNKKNSLLKRADDGNKHFH